MAVNFADYKNIWVFAEQRHGKLMNVALELIGEGHKLSREISADTKVCAVLVGNEIDHLATECFEYGADAVYMIQDPILAQYTTDGYTKALYDAICEYKPEIVMYGATHIGRDLAPRVAARVHTGLTADCTSLEIGSHKDPKTQKEYENLSWWEKMMYPTEASYVQSALGAFKTDYIDPISSEMSEVFEELGIEGSVWASDAMKSISDGLFTYVYDSNGRTFVEYKDNIAGAIITALNDAGIDAKPFALQVAENVGLDLSNGLADQYKLIYDKTTGAVTGVADAAGTKIADMSPDLKAAMEELGVDLSEGLSEGVKKDEPTLMQKIGRWCMDALSWIAQFLGIHSPSEETKELGKYLSEGLSEGMSLTTIKDKLKQMWDTAKSWWNNKVNLSNVSVKFDSIKDKLVDSWNSAKTWFSNQSLKLNIKTPKLEVGWDYNVSTAMATVADFLFGKKAVPYIDLKWYAKGGFPAMGQMFIAREAGPEMVGTIGSRSAVANNDQIVEAVSAGVYSAVVAAMNAANGGGTQAVNVYLDGKQITASVEKRQMERGAMLMTGGMAYGY